MVLSPNIQILRQIISELRLISSTSLVNNLTLRYVFDQFRKHQTTDEQLCKSREEMKFMASTYLCYLHSSRLQKQIDAEFHGKGERTIKQTADIVGFKLPHDPK